jgi:hypothetical protein
MTDKNQDGERLDEALKRAFSDDLPPEVAAGMQKRIDGFRIHRERARRGAESGIGLALRSAWAALSVLMLVSGGLLQALGSRNPLTDRISRFEIRRSAAVRLEAAETMNVSARIRTGGGEILRLDVVWRSGRGSEGRLTTPDGSSLRIGGPDALGGFSDPRLRAAAAFSNPGAVRDLLSRDWVLVGYSHAAGVEIGTFISRPEAGAGRLEFEVDLTACLPVHIALTAGPAGPSIWDARFTF